MSSRTRELRAVAERIAAALPAVVEEVVLTGSVSRGVADGLSDIELLVVTERPLELPECMAHADRLGFREIDTWGVQGTETSRVFGYVDGIPVETIWWPRAFAESFVDALASGKPSGAAEAIVNGIPLRSGGLLETWQRRLRVYPDALAAEQIEDAAVTWGGFHPAGYLTLARPGERLSLVEYLYHDAQRVLRIVYALNRVWQPASKRLADRLDELAVKPERLAARIAEALSEPDAVRALLVMIELQVDTVDLAPAGPNVDRARRWLREVVAVLRKADSASPRSGVRRIKPNILSERFDESRTFYNDVIGVPGGDGLDWILFFGTERREVQLSVMKLDIQAHVHPDVSIEVDDVDAVYERACAAGAEIVYPLTDEAWGLRRFFVRDPNGAVLNVTQHA